MSFEKYIPEAAVSYVKGLVEPFHDLHIRVVSSRKSKSGDFRPNRGQMQIITVNADLSKPQFLITLLHELAHYIDFKKRNHIRRPHGVEWKRIFKTIMEPLQTTAVFEPEVLIELNDYMKNPRASTTGHVGLYRALQGQLLDVVYVESLLPGDRFEFRNRSFSVVRTLRKRVLCREIGGREYLFQPHTPIETLR